MSESELAMQLGRHLKVVEDREIALSKREENLKTNLKNLADREEAVSAREKKVSAESISLEAFKNVSAERAKTVEMVAQLNRDQEKLLEQRSLFAKESQNGSADMQKMKIELSQFKERLEAREVDLLIQEEEFKVQKVKHHERVVRDLSDIELRKARIS